MRAWCVCAAAARWTWLEDMGVFRSGGKILIRTFSPSLLRMKAMNSILPRVVCGQACYCFRYPAHSEWSVVNQAWLLFWPLQPEPLLDVFLVRSVGGFP